jgi:hypothetical protein
VRVTYDLVFFFVFFFLVAMALLPFRWMNLWQVEVSLASGVSLPGLRPRAAQTMAQGAFFRNCKIENNLYFSVA